MEIIADNISTPSSNVHSIITQITPDTQNGNAVNGNGTTTWKTEHQEGKENSIQNQTTFRTKNNQSPALLPSPSSSDVNKKCLVVDLDETLVHSSFKPVKVNIY